MTHSPVTLPGYQLAEQLYEGSRTLVYRGTRNADGKPVVIKFLRNEYLTFSELVQFRNQYTIAKTLDLSGVVKPLALEDYHNGYALVMPDEGYVSLQDWYRETETETGGRGNGGTRKSGDTESNVRGTNVAPNKGQPIIAKFLKIGIQLADILHGLYQNGVIHKDIKPANILIHPVTKQVKLIDFSVASLLSKKTQEIQNPNILEESLSYISPEQTGRMNRGVDYRSEFYSLGVTFYELLTGEFPFQSNDAMELVHCQIAEIPPSLGNREQGIGNSGKIPQVLSDIVMKLMAKNVEEGYQSALELKYDLKWCLAQWQWQETGTSEEFEWGKRGVRDRATQLRQQNAILTDLAKHPALIQGDLPLSLQAITTAAAQTLSLERVSIWFYNPEKTHLDCQNLFELTSNQHSQGIQLTATDYPAYFEALTTELAIVVNNARTDPRTCEFTPNYLIPLGIFSLLDVPIRSRGRVVGVLCLEQVGKEREWTIEDENFARAIADLVTAALEARDRAKAQITLERRNALLQAQQEASIDGILVVNEHHQIVSFNQKFCELWEIPPELTTPDSEKERLNCVISKLAQPEEFLAKIEHLYNHPAEISRDEIRFKDGRILDRYSSPIQSQSGEYYGRIWYFRDITIQKQQEQSLRFMVEGTAFKTGSDFFNSCVRSLAQVLQVRYVLIAEMHYKGNYSKVKTLAFWSGENWGKNFEYDLKGTPCDNIYQCKLLHRYPQNVQQLFPDDPYLAMLEAESYAGVPIFDAQDNLLGLIAILDTQPMNRNLDIQDSILELFAARVGAELERMQAEAKLLKQEQFLRSIYDGTEQAIFVLDIAPDGEFRYVGFNPVAERYVGVTSSESVGKTPDEIFGTEVSKRMRQEYQKCLHSQTATFYEELVFVNGEERWMLTSLSPLKDEKGQIYRIIGTANDITARKKAEEISKEQARWSEFRATIDSILTRENSLPTMLQQCTEVIVEHFDAAFARIWLLNPAENILELKASAGLYTHLDGAHSRIPLGQFKIGLIAQEGKPHLTNTVQSDPRVGDKEWAKREGMVAFAGYPLIVEGQVLGVFAMFARHSLSDLILDELAFITGELSLGIRRKQSEEALQHSELQLRQKARDLEQTLTQLQRTQSQLIQSEKMSSLGQLVAGVAHEINNPVSFIYGNVTPATEYAEDLLLLLQSYQQEYPNPSPELVELMEEVDLDFMRQDLPKLLNSMKFGAERIREIVKSLRTFSRLDEAEVKDVDLHDNINSTLMILQNRLKATRDRAKIEIIKEYGTLPRVECYAGQLNQVFINIISNAIDALEESIVRKQESRKPATLSIRTEVLDRQWVSIQIADNGLGMSETVQQQIFDPFFTTKPVGKGTGLGMAISYQIVVERHRGKLTCQSVPGEGTTFAIAIPIKQENSSKL
ncbi:GAF domain-containing protein [Lusitaniella coriacea]|uniref:GAF domain-containing protein n=1 Tax=Lusitaniella coriacea TaxID=1983105 RepID=UPI003CF23255